MAISKTAIANRALAKIGEKRVSNIDTDNSVAAETIRDMWDNVRDNLIAQYPWNFAIKRKSIAKNTNAPVWEYQNAYTVPTDFLSLLSVRNDPDYRIEFFEDALCIVTDEGSPLKIKYIARIEDTGLFHPMFDAAFAADLAVEASERLTQSNTKKQILLQERELVIKNAFASDAIQDPPQEIADDEWLLARENSIVNDDIDFNA